MAIVKELSLADLEVSKVYESEVSETVKFEHPLDYLSPFLEILDPFIPKWEILGQLGGINRDRAMVIEGVEMPDNLNVSYSRLIAKARLPEEHDINIPGLTDYGHLWTEVGLVYALDGRNPEMKVYSGRRVSTCINQCIFGADSILSIQLLKSSKTAAYDQTRRYLDNLTEKQKVYLDKAEAMSANRLSGSKLLSRIGHVVWEAKKNSKLGIQCANDMVGFIQDSRSKYSLVEGATTDWKLYNACSESLKKSNMLDEASKTLFLEKIFSNDN